MAENVQTNKESRPPRDGARPTFFAVLAVLLSLIPIISLLYAVWRDIKAEIKEGSVGNAAQVEQLRNELRQTQAEMQNQEERARTKNEQIATLALNRQLELIDRLNKMSQDNATIKANLDNLLNGRRR